MLYLESLDDSLQLNLVILFDKKDIYACSKFKKFG